MLYTLLQFLVWGLLLAFVGGVVGWGLRSLKARRDGAQTPPPVENDAPGDDEPDDATSDD